MPISTRRTLTGAQAAFGLVILGLGVAIVGLAAWDNAGELPFAMPRLWRHQRTLFVALAFASIAFGLFAVARGPRDVDLPSRGRRWLPTRRGRRFQSIVLFTREGCHLCDEAFDMLQKYADFLPPIVESDIDTDPRLRERFDAWVPVVEIDGKVRFKGRVSEVLLRRLIEGTPPL